MNSNVLRQYAISKALDLLGPGAATTGFNRELRSWFERALANQPGEPEPYPEFSSLRLLPDAYRIHRNHIRCADDDSFFIIDVIEIEPTHRRESKVERWIEFGCMIESSDIAFLRVRLFNQHFSPVAEYNEEDLLLMSINASTNG